MHFLLFVITSKKLKFFLINDIKKIPIHFLTYGLCLSEIKSKEEKITMDHKLSN
jgi:hypothetical protein